MDVGCTIQETYSVAKIGMFVEGNRTYEGEWLDGKKHGYGIYYNRGSRYEGEWMGDTNHGKGKYVWENGDTYEGDWVNNEQTGKGKLTWASGNVYEGYWLNSKKEGPGVHSWNNGDVHTGEYKKNRKHGRGEYVWVNKNRVEGEWLNGERVSGTFLEFVSGRVFTTDLVDKPGQLHLSFCHPIVNEAIEEGNCTFSRTGKNFYFQYLWRIRWETEEPHTMGICISCEKFCCLLNEIPLDGRHNGPSWGGNFYCSCGSGRLRHPCRLMHPEIYKLASC
eukprot:TRINITY_DN842_c0_g3_i3.p1 TRINITY_DN842_c0_g3~~TRINITY_DN842_c0_g3_i3.p1  ORF type:complete len:277 (-),score=56.41 TRINITY_DN842_c0_g3_i3:86-916(-)